MAYASDIKQYIKCHKCHIVMIRSFLGNGGGRKSCLEKLTMKPRKQYSGSCHKSVLNYRRFRKIQKTEEEQVAGGQVKNVVAVGIPYRHKNNNLYKFEEVIRRMSWNISVLIVRISTNVFINKSKLFPVKTYKKFWHTPYCYGSLRKDKPKRISQEKKTN